LGFPALTDAASVAFGVPMMNQTNFLVESAVNRLLEESLPQVRQIMLVMDTVEQKLFAAVDQDHLVATQLEDLHLREDETDKLEGEYRRWGYRLADIMGCPVYPFSPRYKPSGAGFVTNVSVSH
jgi:hypothetical protein